MFAKESEPSAQPGAAGGGVGGGAGAAAAAAAAAAARDSALLQSHGALLLKMSSQLEVLTRLVQGDGHSA